MTGSIMRMGRLMTWPIVAAALVVAALPASVAGAGPGPVPTSSFPPAPPGSGASPPVGSAAPVPPAKPLAPPGLKEFMAKNGGGWRVLRVGPDQRIRHLYGGRTRRYGRSPADAARAFLADMRHITGVAVADLRFLGSTKSRRVAHTVFGQTHLGIPVEGAALQVHLDTEGRVLWMEDLSRHGMGVATTRARVSAPSAQARAVVELGLAGARRTAQTTKLVILPVSDDRCRLAWKVRFATASPVGDWVSFVDATTGEVISQRNDVYRGAGTVRGKILPNDGRDAQQTMPIRDQWVTVGTRRSTTGADGTYLTSGSGSVSARLGGPWAKTVNAGATGAGYGGTSLTWTWDYPVADKRSEEVNVFYHMNRIHDLLQTTYGVVEMDYEMTATVFHPDAKDNAYYHGGTKELYFGVGSGTSLRAVPLSQASEVIYHEYGHAAHDHVYRGMYEAGIHTQQLRAMGEAWADYFACVMTNDDKVMEWLMTDPAAGGVRYMNNTKKYPDDTVGEEHVDGVVYAGALWDYRMAVGAPIADRTVVASWYYRPTDFQTGLLAMLQADDELYGDNNLATAPPHDTQIRQAFSKHGITTTTQEAISPIVVTAPGTAAGRPVWAVWMGNLTGAYRFLDGTQGWFYPEWCERGGFIVAQTNDPGLPGAGVIKGYDVVSGMGFPITRNVVFSDGRTYTTATHPSVSPSGDHVVFEGTSMTIASGDNPLHQLHITDASDLQNLPLGREIDNWRGDIGANEYNPNWGPTNRIAYAQHSVTLSGDNKVNYAGIWTVNPDGSGGTVITRPVYKYWNGLWWDYNEYTDDSWPAWNHAGTKIAYVRRRSAAAAGPYYHDIHVVNANGAGTPGTRVFQGDRWEGNTARRYLHFGDGILDLSWSPDDASIMFTIVKTIDGLGSPTSWEVWRISSTGADTQPGYKLLDPPASLTSDWGRLDSTPPRVTGVTIAGGIDRLDQIDFSVAAVDNESGVSSYRCAVGSTAGGTDVRGWTTMSGARTQFSLPRLSLVHGRTYFVTVKARNGVGLEGAPVSSAGAVAKDVSPPGPVIALAAVPGSGQVDLSWVRPTSDFAATRVLRSTAGYAASVSSAGQTQIYEGAGTAHRDAGLANGTRYYYTAFARDAAGNWSTPAQVTAVPSAAAGSGGSGGTTLTKASLGRPSLSTSRPRRNRYFYVSGTLKPAHAASTTVRLYFWRRVGRRWVKQKGYVNVRVAAKGARYRVRYRTRYAGNWYVKAYHACSGRHSASWSTARSFRVR